MNTSPDGSRCSCLPTGLCAPPPTPSSARTEARPRAEAPWGPQTWLPGVRSYRVTTPPHLGPRAPHPSPLTPGAQPRASPQNKLGPSESEKGFTREGHRQQEEKALKLCDSHLPCRRDIGVSPPPTGKPQVCYRPSSPRKPRVFRTWRAQGSPPRRV